jgi:hypothetical protein
MKTQLDKKKILDFVTNFSKIAKEKRWISDYDADDDSMAIRAPKLSADARKEHVTEEFAFYITSKNEVEGVFIEYFLSNFVAHHKDFGDVKKELKEQKAKGDDGAMIALSADETRKLVPELQGVIIESLIPDRGFEKSSRA